MTADPDERRQVAPLGRLLWRMDGPSRIVAARIDVIARGCELIIYFEPEEEGDVLGRYSERSPFAGVRLRRRAARLRRALRDHGWATLQRRPRSSDAGGLGGARWGAVGLAGGLGLAALARWARGK